MPFPTCTISAEYRHLVALHVSEDATPHQCQKRYNDTLDPGIKRGSWTHEEDTRLLRAVAAFTASSPSSSTSSPSIPWQDVALFVPGRTNNQCRDRYQDRLSPSEKSKKGGWTEEENTKLRTLVEELGRNDWKEVSKRFGTDRTEAIVCNIPFYMNFVTFRAVSSPIYVLH